MIMNTNEWIACALDSGAYKAFVLPVADIPFDEHLRRYCEANACGSFGKNYACPPGVGTTEEVMARARTFQTALVFQTVTALEDSFDFEGMQAAAEKHAQVAKSIHAFVRKQNVPYLQLTAGGCTICPVCAQASGEPCRFPDEAISSLEAYCMNVAALAERCGMQYINGANTVTYFGAFLVRDA